MENLITELEREWEAEHGFFGKLRYKGFDLNGFHRVRNLLKQIDTQADSLPRRLISLVWFIPLFMTWQDAPNITKEEYQEYCNDLESLVIEALGAP